MSTLLTYLSLFVTVYMAVTVFLALRHQHQRRIHTAQVRRANAWLSLLQKRNLNSRLTFFVIPIAILLIASSTAGVFMLAGTAVVWYYGYYQRHHQPQMRTSV